MQVILSLAACQHLAFTCNERDWRDTGLLSHSDSETLRLTFVRALRSPGPFMFEFDRQTLRALDMLLTDSDPREGKLPDGTAIMGLVETIWLSLLGETEDARDNDHDLIANTDDRATVS